MTLRTRVGEAPARDWRGGQRFLVLVATVVLTAAAAAATSPAPRIVPAHSVLFHDVLDQHHEKIGAVTDLLVTMPSGQVLFVAVTPADLFKRPKAVPLDALAPASNGSLELRMTLDKWLDAPRVAWNGQWVEQLTPGGSRLLARYAVGWAADRPLPEAARFAATVAIPNYVSMRDLLGETVVDAQRQTVGGVGDFLVDWNTRRAVYAVVSPQANGLAEMAVANGFAIPTPMLTPPSTAGTMTVNITPEIARRAPLLSFRNGAPNPQQIFRYQAGTAVANVGR
jgi:sporulation protein YlmC with PRC-barrel domain